MCTTFVAGPLATEDGSVMAAHSNDGDGNTVGNLARVAQADWPRGSQRRVSGGSIPQVSHTHAYFTKVGGYAAMNEHNVGLAESTCAAVFPGNSSTAMLNIVDLCELALERSNTSREAVQTMGKLAETFGYYDEGESLLVLDSSEAFIFHVLPDDTGRSAIWIAQRVPDNHVAVVANSFVIRVVEFADPKNFLFSDNMLEVALRQQRWKVLEQFDFTKAFAGPEPGRKYHSGHRMWAAYRLLAEESSSALSPYYGEYVSSAPYPATVATHNVSHSLMMRTMRDSYQDTTFDMRKGAAAGPFGSPDRWMGGEAESHTVGAWERTIATSSTIVSYIIVVKGWLPAPVASTLWFSMHAAHTSVYVPFPVGCTFPEAAVVPLPESFTNNSLSRVDRGHGAFQASKFVYNVAQLRFDLMIEDITSAQEKWEGLGQQLIVQTEEAFESKTGNIQELAENFSVHAALVASAWWELSDALILKFGDSNRNGYPAWWLRDPDVGFQSGPPPSPTAPPMSWTSIFIGAVLLGQSTVLFFQFKK